MHPLSRDLEGKAWRSHEYVSHVTIGGHCVELLIIFSSEIVLPGNVEWRCLIEILNKY